MELALGIENTKDYLSFETNRAAYKLVKDVMLVKEGENVLISADSSTDMRVVEATANAVYAINGNPVVVYYPTAPNACQEPNGIVGGAVSNAEVWIEYAYANLMHTPSWKKALKNGCRYICATGMDVQMIVNTVGKVNYPILVELGECLKRIVENANEIVIKSDNGTHLVAKNEGRKVRHSGQLATQKGYPIMVGGQISWCPIEATINGTLVFDAALWPPYDLGILQDDVKIEFKDGIAVKIEGGKDAEKFKRWLEDLDDPNMYRLAHYSLGFNPGVTKATGRIVEDERIFGCMEFGMGSQGAMIMGECWSAASHTDGVVSSPTIILDGEVLEKDGVYLHPEVVELCKKLGVQGY